MSERNTEKVLKDLAYFYQQQLRSDEEGMALSEVSPTSVRDKSAESAEKMRSAKRMLRDYKADAVKLGSEPVREQEKREKNRPKTTKSASAA